MHLYVLARGEKDRLARWKNDISGQYLTYHDPSGNIAKVSIAVREVQLLEIVFPEEHLNEVVGMIQPYGYSMSLQKNVFWFQNLLKLEGIPQNIPNSQRIMTHNVEVIGLGIKRDGKNWVGGERL